MMKKFGVNNTRAEKVGPVVKNGVDKTQKRAQKLVTCACGKKYMKDCPSEDLCAVSVLTCPSCGAKVQ